MQQGKSTSVVHQKKRGALFCNLRCCLVPKILGQILVRPLPSRNNFTWSRPRSSKAKASQVTDSICQNAHVADHEKLLLPCTQGRARSRLHRSRGRLRAPDAGRRCRTPGTAAPLRDSVSPPATAATKPQPGLPPALPPSPPAAPAFAGPAGPAPPVRLARPRPSQPSLAGRRRTGRCRRCSAERATADLPHPDPIPPRAARVGAASGAALVAA